MDKHLRKVVISDRPEAVEARKTWVDALRSGEYTQAHRTLRVEDRHCCLGVACDLYPGESSSWETSAYSGLWLFNHRGATSRTELPEEVREYYGINDVAMYELIHRNDGEAGQRTHNFSEIADIIEGWNNEL